MWDGDSLHVEEGAGRFIECPPFGSLYEGLDIVDRNYLAKKFPYGQIPVKRDLHNVGQTEKTEL